MNNHRYRYQEKKTHAQHLEHLLVHPRLLGITCPILWSAKELLVYNEFPALRTEIDLLYRTSGDIWVAEYKTSPGYLKDARRQLDIARDFVKENFSTTPRCLYVSGANYDRIEL